MYRGREFGSCTYGAVVVDFVDLTGGLGGLYDGGALDGDGVSEALMFAV